MNKTELINAVAETSGLSKKMQQKPLMRYLTRLQKRCEKAIKCN